MSAVAFDVRGYDPLREVRHRDAKAARDQADWLSWLELGGTRPRTIHGYRWVTDRLLAMFPDKGIDEFTDGDLIHLLTTYPPASRPYRQFAVVSLFKWAKKTRRITDNPVEMLPELKRQPQRIITVFSDAEQGVLETLPSPDGVLMTVLFQAGLRKAEARNLTAKRCHLNNREIYVREGVKGGKERVVPMSDKLLHALTDFFLLDAIEPNEHLWYDRPGGGGSLRRSKPIGETVFHRWWVKCLEDARVDYRNPHTTRHTYATTWRKRGLAIDEIQILLGHASVQTTSDLYIHQKVEDVAAHMARIEAGI